MFCTRCGAASSENDIYCRQCGHRRSGAPGATDQLPGASAHSSDAGRDTSSDGGYIRLTAPPPPPADAGPHTASYRPGEFYSGPSPEVPPPGSQPYAGDPGWRAHGEMVSAESRTRAIAGAPPPGAFAPPPPLMPAVITCSGCGMPMAQASDRCRTCGSSRALVSAGACFKCGAGNPASNRYCGRCGSLLVSNALTSHRTSSSALPVVGSMILPGLGQMMNGEAMKGFMLLGAALVMISQGATIFQPIYLFITAIAVVDAAISRSRREGASYRSRSWA